MPRRIIRDGLLTSYRIDQLDVFAERFYVRLLLVVDDFGRFDADPRILRSSVFPVKDSVRTTDISRWLAACEKAGLMRLYTVCGKEYLEILDFRQAIRAKISKYPPPEEKCDAYAMHMRCIRDADAMQMRPRDEDGDGDGDGDESINILSREQHGLVVCSRQEETPPSAASAAAPGRRSSTKIWFDYAGDGKIHGITQEQLERWRQSYPALDVEQEIRKAAAWLDANREQRKRLIARFLVNWLNRSQERAPRLPAPRRNAPAQKPEFTEGDRDEFDKYFKSR